MPKKFYYPIKLHYSQTGGLKQYNAIMFYYPIKLHYSQTTTWTVQNNR